MGYGAVAAVQAYYSSNFLPRLSNGTAGTPNLQAYLPVSSPVSPVRSPLRPAMTWR